jgi:hypothetical protein
MNTKNKILPLILVLLLTLFNYSAHAQLEIVEAIQGATKKVIRAIDLKIQRLQNRTIDLQNIQKEIENILSKLKLDEIADWTRKQKEIYQEYFDELWRVKSAIAYYRRITDLIGKQKTLVAEYRRAYGRICVDKNFSPGEVAYIHAVYSGIIQESAKSLDQILLVIESLTVQMSDADRLEIIDRAGEEIENHIDNLRSFTNHTVQTSLQRTRDVTELERIKKLYGL